MNLSTGNLDNDQGLAVEMSAHPKSL